MMSCNRVFRTLNICKYHLRKNTRLASTFQQNYYSKNTTQLYQNKNEVTKLPNFLLNLKRNLTTGIDTGSKEHIQSLVKNNKVVVFMKGIPDKPMCGFSNAVVQILRMHGVEYNSHNVLDDDSLRAGIKEFSEWPTIPQIYFNGEFVGGCDIFLQMHQSGDIIEELKSIGIRSALLDEEPK
uniref:LOW QUALITY PROTEIN: glutaredoxin-related protein 5, mitochondrial-like n=1 Tax=Ciona intestinalis TaxID=7719 RepID=UPI0005213F22|nr:LOW QUALITY PROTEIN: glutaredoxin-related protein 5, mitochondrial-like [Ciona intestinalis]|eukprot:XP_009858324.1 LOW QUALITY PROTEIN: glutaredoxin-related protein 5, mitochondrial-like [Ciona intestinalis]